MPPFNHSSCIIYTFIWYALCFVEATSSRVDLSQGEWFLPSRLQLSFASLESCPINGRRIVSYWHVSLNILTYSCPCSCLVCVYHLLTCCWCVKCVCSSWLTGRRRHPFCQLYRWEDVRDVKKSQLCWQSHFFPLSMSNQSKEWNEEISSQ